MTQPLIPEAAVGTRIRTAGSRMDRTAARPWLDVSSRAELHQDAANEAARAARWRDHKRELLGRD